ncbi:deaminase [Pseudomonas aeruginosa]|uniref:deaminase n=1 Tax=Pseudomonas aeruginosa TaxID=287 RepID=UPI0018C59955|nr:deaminase [Pseudomonas aeruginosa]MBG4736721.1 dCMP deaminase [Pseudomonas aeruginosa]MCQ9837195.1 deaminase [Pseudomonas aeruginosa]MCQ9863042.1 deaminase [Pseudomonas aeruginosa]MCS8056775.1 deaminase [Pseudomonas aeruginosa]MCT0838287.1 deaminase [Pseudomonas aeruginosa]
MQEDLQQHRTFMERAIQEMSNSPGSTKVGAVLVVDNEIVATGFKSPGCHAERAAIEQAKANGIDLKQAVLYTTLEPCVQVKETQTKVCCSNLILDEGIRKVFIGYTDPNPRVLRQGWRSLRDSAVELRYFPEDLRSRIEAIDPFVHVFNQDIGPTGTMQVDVLEPKTVTIQFSEDDPRTMSIRWSWSGKGEAFAYNSAGIEVALAREAKEFSEVDDPGVFEFGPQARVPIGGVVIFRHQDAYLLAKVIEAQAGPSYGDKHYLVKFKYEIRVRN